MEGGGYTKRASLSGGGGGGGGGSRGGGGGGEGLQPCGCGRACLWAGVMRSPNSNDRGVRESSLVRHHCCTAPHPRAPLPQCALGPGRAEPGARARRSPPPRLRWRLGCVPVARPLPHWRPRPAASGAARVPGPVAAAAPTAAPRADAAGKTSAGPPFLGRCAHAVSSGLTRASGVADTSRCWPMKTTPSPLAPPNVSTRLGVRGGGCGVALKGGWLSLWSSKMKGSPKVCP